MKRISTYFIQYLLHICNKRLCDKCLWYLICEKYLWQLFVISIWHQLLHQLLIFVSNVNSKQHWIEFKFLSLWYFTFSNVSRYIHHVLFASVVYTLKCIFPFLVLLYNLIKTNVIVKVMLVTSQMRL